MLEKTALQAYPHDASKLDTQDLADFLEDGDFTVVCTTRLTLEKAALSPDQVADVKAADTQLAAQFTPELLAEYADYFPSMPIPRWWGR